MTVSSPDAAGTGTTRYIRKGSGLCKMGWNACILAALQEAEARTTVRASARRRDFIANAQVAGLAPEFGEPAANDRLVVVLFAHVMSLHCWDRRSGIGDLREGIDRLSATRTSVLALVSTMTG